MIHIRLHLLFISSRRYVAELQMRYRGFFPIEVTLYITMVVTATFSLLADCRCGFPHSNNTWLSEQSFIALCRVIAFVLVVFFILKDTFCVFDRDMPWPARRRCIITVTWFIMLLVTLVNNHPGLDRPFLGRLSEGRALAFIAMFMSWANLTSYMGLTAQFGPLEKILRRMFKKTMNFFFMFLIWHLGATFSFHLIGGVFEGRGQATFMQVRALGACKRKGERNSKERL